MRASEPFASAAEAAAWLDSMLGSGDATGEALEDAVRALNGALHAHAVSSGLARPQALGPERAALARLGYGSGEEVAESTFTEAREVDAHASGSRRRRRAEQLRPQERVAAVLGGRERLDACETLILRARADLDAGRDREAALQLRVGLEALLIELSGALADPGHEEDMATLKAQREEVAAVAGRALRGDLDATQRETVQGLTAICERVLRRRRVLGG